MSAVFNKELRSFFNNLSGFIYCAFMLLFVGIYTTAVNLSQQSSRFEYTVANMSFVYLLAIPVLTMRIISEDKRQKTDRLYYSLPVSMSSVVLGKYFATLVTLAFPIAIMCLYPLLLSLFGTVSFTMSFGTIFGFFMLGAALCAVGMFISSLTENQIVAAVITVVVILVNYYLTALASLITASSIIAIIVFSVLAVLIGFIVWWMTKNFTVAAVVFAIIELVLLFIKNSFEEKFSTLVPTVMEKISLFDRFYNFPNGIFDITTLVFDLMVIVVFIFLTVQAMEKRRWS